jgi:hypothetical protein
MPATPHIITITAGGAAITPDIMVAATTPDITAAGAGDAAGVSRR